MASPKLNYTTMTLAEPLYMAGRLYGDSLHKLSCQVIRFITQAHNSPLANYINIQPA